MTPLFEKMNLATHREILVLNPPESFEAELAKLNGVSIVRTTARLKPYAFAVFFVVTLKEVERCATILDKAAGDACVWFAYPKGTSKKYTCEFNRDTGWSAVRLLGFETVRQVSVDEDWTALRFRRVEYMKSSIRLERAAATVKEQPPTAVKSSRQSAADAQATKRKTAKNSTGK